MAPATKADLATGLSHSAAAGRNYQGTPVSRPRSPPSFFFFFFSSSSPDYTAASIDPVTPAIGSDREPRGPERTLQGRDRATNPSRETVVYSITLSLPFREREGELLLNGIYLV